jgi:hypothetical protein
MAKAKKEKPVEPVIDEVLDNSTDSLPGALNDSEVAVINEPENKPDVEHPLIYVPDIPAQSISSIEEKPDTDEILFLKRIMQIQEEGGFGKHLHDIINERIKSLK